MIAGSDILDALADRIAAKVIEGIAEIAPPPNTSEPWRLLNAKEAGQLLGRSERWVYAASAIGSSTYLRLPFVLVGERKMYDPEALKRWANDRSIPG